jgi:hypothetical protein
MAGNDKLAPFAKKRKNLKVGNSGIGVFEVNNEHL